MALQNGGWCSCGDQFSTSGASESKTKTSIHSTLVGHHWEVFFLENSNNLMNFTVQVPCRSG